MDDPSNMTPPPEPMPEPSATPAAPPVADPGVPVAPVAPPRKKKTWLWIVLAIVGLALAGCAIAAVLGFGALKGVFGEMFGSESPGATIGLINQAVLDGDRASYEKYFDTESVVSHAYGAFLETLKDTEDYAALVDELGEDAAEQMLTEEILPKDTFVAEMTQAFDIDALEDGDVPFPDYTISNTSINNDMAELTLTIVDGGENTEFVLRLQKEAYGDESVWRVKEIVNFTDLLGDE